ncbi:MAG: APC family permease [Ktedonobacteraceae bacterium]|nr:APC family permease [Ktedonobacteraceae bacterium]
MSGVENETARPGALPSEELIPQVMPPVLGVRDSLASYVLALFLISNAVLAATGGAVSLTYLVIGGLFFLLPCVVATIQLGAMYPHEGSLYNWTYHALGGFWGFFVSLCYWLSGVLAPVTAMNLAVAILQGLHPTWLVDPWQQGLVMIALLFVAGWLCMGRLRRTQNVINVSAILLLVSVGLITLACVVWLLTGHASKTNFSTSDAWAISPANFSLFGIITLNFIGASGVMNMAGEFRHQNKRRIIKSHLLLGTPVIFACYTLVSLAILVIRGQDILNDANPSFAAVGVASRVLGPWAGDIVAVSIFFFAIASSAFYMNATSRLVLVGAIDRFLPKNLARFNAQRAPVNALWLQVGGGVLIIVLVFIVSPLVVRLGNSAVLTTQIFTVLSAALTVIWTIATLFHFVDLFFLYRHGQLSKATRVFPAFVLWLTIAVGIIMCSLTIVGSLTYSWIGPLLSDASWRISVSAIVGAYLIIALIISLFARGQADFEVLVDESTDLRENLRRDAGDRG